MSKDFQTWYLDDAPAAPRGKTRWVEGMFSFEVEKALEDQLLCGGGIRFMLCSSGPKSKNYWGEDLDSL